MQIQKTILSGIQPSGTLHIGNYFGMIKRMIQMQSEGDLMAFIASYHSLTTVRDKEVLKMNIKNAVLDFLALGIDTEKSTFFIQSDVSEVLELSLILSNLTSMGLLERSHSYKDKINKGISPNHGLFSYPILMAADILLYDTDIVPVGKDQLQHLEISRVIAKAFNNTYGNTFRMPEELIEEEVQTIIGTNGEKMSKSYDNTIDIFGTKKRLKKQIGSIITETVGLEDIKNHENCNVYKLCELFMNEDELKGLQERYLTPGYGHGHFKKDLMKKIEDYFEPYKEKREYFMNNDKLVQEMMEYGANKAKIKAKLKINEVREKIGL